MKKLTLIGPLAVLLGLDGCVTHTSNVDLHDFYNNLVCSVLNLCALQ